MRRSATEDNLFNFLATSHACFAGAMIHPMLLLKFSAAALGIDIIAQGAAAMLDCLSQDDFN
jgi:hypothetical protein